MRFARWRDAGSIRPLVADDGSWHDLSGVVDDITPSFVADPPDFDLAGLLELPEPPAAELGPPLVGIGKVVCIGLNYRDHALESGLAVPEEPVVFMKAPDTVVGPNDQVLVPRGSTKTDWEVELAVIIGTEARYLESPEQSRAHVFGYAVSHDVSEREFQLERGGQWDKGKNCETFNPLGPWIRTADEVPDPQDLALWLSVNGATRQSGSTRDMVFGVDHLIWYLSQFMVLRPGDVINTGTPAGVALGRPDHPYLRVGDVVELEIDGLGRQRQTFGAA